VKAENEMGGGNRVAGRFEARAGTHKKGSAALGESDPFLRRT